MDRAICVLREMFVTTRPIFWLSDCSHRPCKPPESAFERRQSGTRSKKPEREFSAEFLGKLKTYQRPVALPHQSRLPELHVHWPECVWQVVARVLLGDTACIFYRGENSLRKTCFLVASFRALYRELHCMQATCLCVCANAFVRALNESRSRLKAHTLCNSNGADLSSTGHYPSAYYS